MANFQLLDSRHLMNDPIMMMTFIRPKKRLKSLLQALQEFILTEYSAACCVGSMLLQNLYPKGQNSVIPRPLAAGIGILKVLPVYSKKNMGPE
jgi:hypothetical protein